MRAQELNQHPAVTYDMGNQEKQVLLWIFSVRAQELNQHPAVTYDMGNQEKQVLLGIYIFFVVLRFLRGLNIHDKHQSKTLLLYGALSHVFPISYVVSCKIDRRLLHSDRNDDGPKFE